ncbi:MAG: ATP/GTP-binding protein [Candidatus Helarchaeota archaeon]|nr:ATP/GTP-binding protein [Candidatus Helarchaeota archaeon]
MTSLAVIFMGQAGCGKSNLCASFGKWLKENEKSFKLINLDPGAEYIPFNPNFDIRQYFTISDIMKKEKLGPNGAMIRANNKINEISDEIIEKIIGSEDFILIDLPGQLETFIFRQSGANFIQKLQTKIRVVGIYLIDAEFLSSATDFVIATLIGTSCSLQLPIDVVSILHKSDKIINQEIIKIVHDFDFLKKKVIEEKKGAMINVVLPILDNILEPIARIIKTSSVTNEGMLELYELINEIFCACGDIS